MELLAEPWGQIPISLNTYQYHEVQSVGLHIEIDLISGDGTLIVYQPDNLVQSYPDNIELIYYEGTAKIGM